MINKYYSIFKELENSLSTNYTYICNKINLNIFSVFNLFNNFCNERSVAYYSSNFFEKQLINYVNDFSLINEAAFTMKKNISPKAKKKLTSEVDNLAKKEFKNQLEPDAVVYFNYDNTDYRYFVEYKVHHNYFKYIELANDYLKYKIYTSSHPDTSAFVYIVFNKNNKKMPTILNGTNSEPQIQFLNKKITKSEIDKNANVFIYDPKIKSLNCDKPKNLEDHIGYNEIKILDKIVNGMKKLTKEYSSIDYSTIPNYSEDPFVKNINCLGTNVSTANILQKYYKYISGLYLLLNENENSLIAKLNELEPKLCIDSTDKLLEWMQGYFRNFTNSTFKKEKESYNKVVINGSTRKSLILLVIIDKFCKENKIDFFHLSFRNKDEQRDYEKIKKTDFYLRFYRDSNSKEKFDILAKTIILYIFNLYNIIFDVENTNTTAEYLEYRDEFKHFLAKKNILDNISTIKALFGLNRKQKVDWELDLNELGKSLLELVVNYDYE